MVQQARAELERRARRYRGAFPARNLRGRCALIVDDGIATGSTARAACEVARHKGAARVVVATPVAPRTVAAALRTECDEMVCVEEPEHFFAVGEWYDDFSPTTDDEVVSRLRGAQL
jgi:putative phosphoribosyl transferase